MVTSVWLFKPRSHGRWNGAIGSGAGEVGSFSWRSRARRLVGSSAHWRLCSIAIFLRVACFLCSVFLEPFY